MPLKVKKVTGPTIAASVQFNGTNQYLSLPNTSTMQMGTSDYTVEAWIYPTANGQANSSQIFGQTASGVSSQFIFGLTSANKIINYIEYAAGGGSAGPVITSATSITLNTWTHVATSRVSGVTRIFINGVLDASASDAGGYRVVSHNFSIGSANGAGSTFFAGYISNVRVIKGTGLYTTNFTPTRATLSAVTNTSLLTCHDTSIYDASTNNFTITNNNTATVSTVSPFPVLRSVSFNGSNQYLSIANNAAFNFGTGSFTIEWWQYLNSGFAGTTGFPMGQKANDGTNGWQIYRNTSVNTDKISVRFSGGDYVTTVTPSSQVWEHWALVRDNSSTLTWYRNGTACGVYSNVTSNISDSAQMNIGYAQTWGYTAASSSISNLRILKGTALYTASFTPAGPLTAIASCSLLTCNDQTIRDASTNNFTITNNNTATVSTVTPFTAILPSSMKFKKTSTGTTGRSVLFNGSNQYLSLSNSAAFNFGTGDLTIEFWIYFTAASSGRAVTSRLTGGGDSGTWSVGMSTTSLNFTEVISGEPGPSATFSSILNTWAHIAVCRSSGTTKLFLNGSQVASAAQTTNFNNISYPVYIATSPAESYLPAYISNLRILKSTGLYTSSFSAPTSPLTAIANTSLLTCNAATIVDASSNNFAITNNNGATVSSVTPFLSTPGTFKVKKAAAIVLSGTQKAIFGYGMIAGGTLVSTTNLVSNTGVVATDTTGVGTVRSDLAAAGYGNDKAIFGYGNTGTATAVTNLVSNTGVVATDTAGVGTARYYLAAAGYGTDKAIFGYGYNGTQYQNATNKVSNAGVVATDTTGVGTTRQYLAAAGYGTDKAIFGYGRDGNSNYVSTTNLVSNAGVVATDTTGVGTIRYQLAAAGYGTDKAIFGYGAISTGNTYYSMTNLVSNTGVVATDTTGVGTARGNLAAAGYGTDKAIFGYGSDFATGMYSTTNKVSNTGVVATNTTGVGTARQGLAAAGYSLT